MAAAARPTATSPIAASSTTTSPTLVKGLGLDWPGVHARWRASPPAAAWCCASPAAAGRLFDDYLAISPYIAQDSPTNKPNSGGWAGVAVPRIVALSLLDSVRPAVVPGAPAVHFATAAKAEQQPHAGLFLPAGGQPAARARLARGAGPHQRADHIVVGANDELFNADQFQP